MYLDYLDCSLDCLENVTNYLAFNQCIQLLRFVLDYLSNWMTSGSALMSALMSFNGSQIILDLLSLNISEDIKMPKRGM